MSNKTTIERLFEHYNTYTRRPVIDDPQVRRVVFKSFKRTLRPWLPKERTAHILDIACGEGAFLFFLKEQCYTNLYGFDLSPENVAICHRLGLDFVRVFDALEIEKFPGPPEGYDAIFALDIIEHLPKAKAAEFLDRTREQLRPGGYLVLQTPNAGFLMGTYHRYNDLSHEFILTEKTARDLLMVAGFRNEDIEIRPAWNATTFLGYLREVYLRLLHRFIFLAEDAARPTIPTKNLLIRGRKP